MRNENIAAIEYREVVDGEILRLNEIARAVSNSLEQLQDLGSSEQFGVWPAVNSMLVDMFELAVSFSNLIDAHNMQVGTPSTCTHVSERKTKSRPSVCNSRGTKARKLKEFREYITSKKARDGLEMIPWQNQHQDYMLSSLERDTLANVALTPAAQWQVSHDSMTLKKSREGVLVSFPVHDQQTCTSGVCANIIDASNEQHVNIWDLLFNSREYDFTARKRFMETDLQAINNRVVDMYADRCMACNVSGLRGHNTSREHQQAIHWHASCDQLLGNTPVARVFASGYPLGPDGELAEADLKRFWGCDVFELGMFAMKIILKKGLFVKPHKSAHGFVMSGADIADVSMAFVEFTCVQGGKYSRGGARLRWTHQLPAKLTPPKDPLATWWPIVAVSFKAGQENVIANLMDMQVSEKLDDNHIVWDNENKVDVHVAGPGQFGVCASSYIWISSVEQLQRDVPRAWPLPLHNQM
jgi:hypothetical protein